MKFTTNWFYYTYLVTSSFRNLGTTETTNGNRYHRPIICSTVIVCCVLVLFAEYCFNWRSYIGEVL